MLRICHEHKYTGNVKGSHASINATIIIITSNEPWTMWEKWKGHDKAPWERRVTDWLEFKWVPDPDEPRQQAVLVNVIKGEFINCDDPPHDGAPTRRDEEIEDLLQVTDTNHAKWLPARKREHEYCYAGMKKPRIRMPEWDELFPEVPDGAPSEVLTD